ncbi:MAG TPA: hypothetical protein VKD70_13410 [Candidatus Acidoferrum sp.]|nr:hypothetical protein [Candidatus Acidoferrum sp.]
MQNSIFRRTLALMATAALSLWPVAPAFAGQDQGGTVHLTPVVSANHKTVGIAVPNVLSPELIETIVAQGSNRLENPSELTSFYGYDNGGPFVPAPGDVQAPGHNVEATKTEPDKNTYLVLRNQQGTDPNYDYGTHFLFQGHELGQGGKGYVTRINLDADGAHRVTLMATSDVNGNPLPTIDGSTWYPFSHRLLFTSESGSNASVLQATLDVPSQVEDISGILGRGGYEGIQADTWGRLIIVEDVGGKNGTANPHARQPNSFVYRFLPATPSDLKAGGKLQVLQVMSKAHPGAIGFHAADIDGDITSQDQVDLHTYGLTFQTNWVTVHDTAVNGFAPFGANALAKAAGGTPFKRPENGQFRPGSNFSEFIFDATGDTNALTEAANFGGLGAIFRLRLAGNGGTLSLVYRSDVAHSGFDNCGFWDADHIVFVEDAGDTLHTQRSGLDSAFMFDLNADYSNPANQPVRILAEGRDTSATLDSGLGAVQGSGFQNEGDNEITGWHQSDGDPSVFGLLGAKIPTPFRNGWRLFFTQQHGDNFTWEILPAVQNSENQQ